MGTCINKNHPDFIKLQLETGLNPLVLAAEVGVWQEKHNTEAFPDSSTLLNFSRNQDNEVIVNNKRDLTKIQFSLEDSKFPNLPQAQALAKYYNFNNQGFSFSTNLNEADLKKKAKALGYGIRRGVNGKYFFTYRNRFINIFNPNQQYSLNENYGKTVEERKEATPSYTASEKQLVNTLKGLMAKMGFQETAIESFQTIHGVNVQGAVDFVSKLYAVANNKNSLKVFTEETVHAFTALLPESDATFQHLLNIVSEHPKYQEVKKLYGDVYADEITIRKEAVDQIIRDIILDKYNSAAPAGFWQAIMDFFTRIFDAVRRSLTGYELARQVHPYYTQLADRILKSELDNGPIYNEDAINTIYGSTMYSFDEDTPITDDMFDDPEVKAIQEFGRHVDNVIDKLKIRLGRYQATKASSDLEAQEQKGKLNSLLSDVEVATKQKAFADLLLFMKEDLAKISNAITSDSNASTNMELQYLVAVYQDLDLIMIGEYFPEELREIASELHKDWKKLSIKIKSNNDNIIENFLTATSNKGSEILEVLKDTTDISFDQMALGALANSENPILANLDKVYKEHLRKIQEESLEFSQEFEKRVAEGKRALARAFPGSKVTYEGLLGKDKNGNPTVKFVDEATEEYYEMRKEAFKPIEGESAAQRVQRIRDFYLETHMLGDSTKPLKPKYASEGWKTLNLPENRDALEFYNYLRSIIEKADANIPEQYGISHTRNIPAFSKSFRDMFKQYGFGAFKGLGKKFKESFKYARGHINNPQYLEEAQVLQDRLNAGDIDQKTFDAEIEAAQAKYNQIIENEMGEEVYSLPVHGTRELQDKTQQSLDLGQIVSAYYIMSLSYKHKSAMRDLVETTRRYFEDNKVEAHSKGRDKLFNQLGKRFKQNAKDSNTYIQFNHWMKYVFYEQTPDAGRTGNLDNMKLAKFTRNWTTWTGMALNLKAGVSNKTVGEAMNWLEAAGGRFYSVKHYRKAFKQLHKELPQIVSKKKDSKLMAFMTYFDLMMDTSQLHGSEQTESYLHEKIFDLKNIAFSIYHMGEFSLQAKNALAVAYNTPIRDKDNNIIYKEDGTTPVNLYDAFEIEDGHFRIKEEYKDSNIADFKTRAKIQGKIKTIYQFNHGRYDQAERTVMENYWLGMLALQFRRWMHANYEARFRKEFYHEQLDANMKGRYLSYGAFYKEIKKQFAEERLLGLVKLRKAAKNLNELDAANMKKNMVEMAMMVATFLMYNALKAMGDDDDELKDNRAFNFALYQLDRFNGEMSFMNFGLITGQGWQVLKNPVPAVSTFTTMGDLLVEGLKFGAYQTGVAGLEEDDVTVQRGYMKGKYKATKELYDAVPLVRQVIDFLELEDQKNFLRK